MADERLPAKDGCPVCFAMLDAATCATGDAKPKPGDLSVCLYCTTFLRFDEQLRHVKLEPGEFSKLEETNRRMLLRARKIIKSRNLSSHESR